MTTTESRLLARMRERQATASIPRRADGSDTVLSFAQRRMWFLDQLTPGSAEYVVPCGFQLRGTVDVPALEAAFSAVVARHEVLRTRFVTGKDGEPRQVVDSPWPVE